MANKKGFFTGELMICVVCGKQQHSNPGTESNWRIVEIDGQSFYACPNEFPPDGSGKKAFKVAYQLVMACSLNEICKASGGVAEPAVESYQEAKRHKEQLRNSRKVHRTKKGFGTNNS